MEHEHPPHGHYLIVFIALCVLTALSVVTDVVRTYIPSVAVIAVIVLAVATAKALCVMGYFMHLRFERNWKYVLLAPTIILACGIPLALLPDVGVHYYTPTGPQERELRAAMRDVLHAEDKSQPLSDKQIAEKLREEHHYDVSAGKVAFYRETMDIPPSEQRKAE